MRRVVAPAALCGWLLLQGCGSEPAAPAAEEASGGTASASSNSPPVIEEVTLVPSRPRPGETVQAHVKAHDPDGNPMRFDYHWRAAGRSLPEAEGKSALHVEKLPRQSEIEVTVVAHDEHGESAPQTATARVGNLAPMILSVGMQPEGKVSAGVDITAIPRATDLDGGEIEYQYHWMVNGETVPVEGATLPGDRFHRGDHIVLEVIASDGDAESEPVVSPPIPVVNAPPRVVSEPGQISADGIFRYTLKTEDPDGDSTFRYRLVKGPRGMSVGFDDGKVTWQPPADAAGTHDVEIEVEDLFGGSSTYRFALQLSYQTQQAPVASTTQQAPAAATTQQPAKATAKQEPLGRPSYEEAPPPTTDGTWTHHRPGWTPQPKPAPADQESEAEPSSF